jgi:predicted lactoylglutathione lyase
MAILPDMIGLVVDDLRATTAFYQLLGLAIPEFGPQD